MSKFSKAIIGGLEIAGGIALSFVPGGAAFAPFLISAGAGQLISGLGTLLSKGPVKGFSGREHNPTAPWNYVYGEQRVEGTIVFENTWPRQPSTGLFFIPIPIPTSSGGTNQILDRIYVLAASECESVDAVLFDGQRIAIDITARVNTGQDGIGAMSAGPSAPTGTSYTPLQQTNVSIAQIQRSQGVVTVTLARNIPTLIEGDQIDIEEDGAGTLTAAGLIGTFQVLQIISQVFGGPGSIVFTYLSGGEDVTITGHGHINTLFADFGRTVYFEPMLGGQSLGQTFNGMVFGTPLRGDMGDIITPDHTGGVAGKDTPNPWTANASLQGKTCVFLRIIYDAKYYSGGLPQISFLVRGKNDILNPRTSPPTVGYTANAALCIADFLALEEAKGGLGLAYGTQIPIPDLIAAANLCDEQVPLAYSLASPPLTENAYECNGQFDLDKETGEILRNMLTSCAGRITDYGGQYRIWPGGWIGNSFAIGSNPGGGVIPLGDFNSIAAGPFRWRESAPGRDLYNGIKGTYISKANKWQPADFPPYCQDEDHGYGPGGLVPAGTAEFDYDASLQADGGVRRWKDIQLPFTTSYSAAQRIAKIMYLRERTPGVSKTRSTGTLVLNMTGYQIATLDLMLLTGTYLNFSAEQLEVVDIRFSVQEGKEEEGEGPSLSVELDVQETDPTIYDWSPLEELSPAGYVQPALPGVSALNFFANETVPGYDVPYPWSPAYSIPLAGDALYTGPQGGSPVVSQAKATFGLQIEYEPDAQGSPNMTLEIQGVDPANQPSTLAPPQIINVTVGTSGNLPAGSYIVAAAVIDSEGLETVLGTALGVTIPLSSPPVNNGSIEVAISYPSPSETVSLAAAEVFMGPNVSPGKAVAGYYRQGGVLSTLPATFTITDFDQSQPGAPDSTVDHYGVAWKKAIHSGVWAQQIVAVTSDTITFGGPGMTTNQWAGYVLSLLGKLDSTQELIELNMPVASSTASTGASPGPPEFTVTIGANSAGDTLPNLTKLLVVGDLLVMRQKWAFTATSMTDANVANPYFPLGATNVEAGHVAVVLTGPDAGDVQTIGSISAVGGKLVDFQLAGQWLVTPNDGDIVIIAEAAWGPEFHTQSFSAPQTNAVSGVIAAPEVQNLGGQTWLVIVRMQTAGNVNGSDRYAPIKDFYVFGSQGTRTITKSQSMLPPDSVIDFDASSGAIVYTCLPFSKIPNQKFYLQKVDDSANPATINTFASPGPAYFLTLGEGGTLEVATGVGAAVTVPASPTPTFLQVYADLVSAPVGSAVTLEIQKNGSNWAALTIADGAFVSNVVTGLALASGDVLTLNVTAVGSTNPGTNLSVYVQLSGGPIDTINDANGVAQQTIVLAKQWSLIQFTVSAGVD